MAVDIAADLKAFRDFIDAQLRANGPKPSPEECVRLWREREEIDEALHTAFEELQAGLGRPLEEFAAEFRERNGIDPNA